MNAGNGMSEAEKKATIKFIKTGNAKGIDDDLMFMVGAVAFSEFYMDMVGWEMSNPV